MDTRRAKLGARNVLEQFGEHGKRAQRSRRGLITPRSRLLVKYPGYTYGCIQRWTCDAVNRARYTDAVADFSIRSAAEADLDRLLELQRDSPEAAQWSPAQYRSAISGESGLECRVADANGAVEGMIVFRGPLGGETEILNLAVSPLNRRRGIGKALVDAACEQPADFFLEVRRSNHRGIRFYRKCGFHPAGHRKDYYRDPAEDALVMKRSANHVESGP